MAGRCLTIFEMITTTRLPSPGSYGFLNKVNQHVLEWQLQPVVGRGLYSKHESIAYVELKIYAAKPETYTSQVVWNIPSEQLPQYQPDCQSDIEEGIFFFLRYLTALRGEIVCLIFEINDLAFHETCARHNPFRHAVVYALSAKPDLF